jgi:hypothetical protein
METDNLTNLTNSVDHKQTNELTNLTINNNPVIVSSDLSKLQILQLKAKSLEKAIALNIPVLFYEKISIKRNSANQLVRYRVKSYMKPDGRIKYTNGGRVLSANRNYVVADKLINYYSYV